MINNKERYSWFQFEEDIAKIAAWATDKKFKSIYGIPRGGLVPAVKISNILEIPLILHCGDITPSTLVVDDIIDNGKTLKRFLRSVDVNCCVASIFLNKSSSIKPDFFVRQKKKKQWIVFPWETDESSRYDGTV